MITLSFLYVPAWRIAANWPSRYFLNCSCIKCVIATGILAGGSPRGALTPNATCDRCAWLPGRTAENSPALKRWDWVPEGLSLEGTADRPPIQPSLWDLAQLAPDPSVETLGYSHPSLRDEHDQILMTFALTPAV